MAMISKAISTVAQSGANIGDVINVAVGVGDYKNARQQGDGRIKAGIKAGASFAWGEIYYGGLSSVVATGLGPVGKIPFLGGGLTLGLTFGLSLAPAAISMVSAASENGSKLRTQKWANAGSLGSGYFNMSEAGYTMRQRSLNAIRSNGLNTQSVLGNEARTYFRSTV